MSTRVCFVVLCLGVVLSTRLTMALGGFEMELLMTKMDFMEDKLHEVEQVVKTALLHEMANLLEKMEIRLQERFETKMNFLEKTISESEQASKDRHTHFNEMLIRFEKVLMERIDNLQSKFDARIQAMEESLTKSVKTSEELLKNQLISKMDKMQLQQEAKTKTIQETTQTELMKLLSLIRLVPLRSCREAPKNNSDKYMIQPGIKTQPFEVLCEQTKFDGGWTVIQQRFDGSVDFYRNWTEYRNGFGSLDGEFWLGLEYVHQLTKNRPHELMVEVEDFHSSYRYAKYSEFEIGSETEGYAMKKLGTYSGTAGDSMRDNKDSKFSTFDRDNDQFHDNCAEHRLGAWWHYRCAYTNLNGRYQNTFHDWSAMFWFTFENNQRGLSYSRMMIRDIIV